VTGLSADTVRRLIASGQLRTYRVGGRLVRVVVGDVARLTNPGAFTPLDEASSGGPGA
jgi:excisionase family DNA binding protein